MVYRYESDEDAFVEYPERGSDLSVLGAGPPPPAGPSPSRFPTPSLPRTTRRPLPPPEPEPVPASPRPHAYPAPEPEPVPVPPRPQAYPSPEPEPVPAPPRPQAYPSPEPAESVPPAATSVAPAPPATPVVPEAPAAAPVPPPRAGGRGWQVLVGGAAVLVLLALCGLAAAALLADRGADPISTPTEQPAAADTTEAEPNDLDSRDTDQAPLTAKEVFPGQQLVVSDGQPAYPVLKTQSSGSCAVAATGEVADLLVRLGCNQVVRATLRTPDGEHLVTAGLFNLTDRASAERARDRIRQMLDERQGRFRGMAAGEETEAIATAPARVGWQVRGHYLAYALVARADGESIRAGDTKVREILFDMIELHLNEGVLERRAEGGVAGQPTAGADSADNESTQD